MATDIERLVIRLEAQMKSYEKELAKQRGNTDKELKHIEGRFSKAEGVIAGFGKGLIGGALGALSFGALAKSAEEAAGAISKIGETAETVGVSTDFLQGLQFAGLEAGIKSLDTALEQFVVRSDELTRSEGALFDKLKAINPEIARQAVLAGDQEQRFKLVAEAIKNASSAEEKAAIARSAFGKSGVEMVRILKDGSDGVDEFGRRAKELGVILDKDLIKRADELGDKLDAAKKMLGVELQRALIDLLPLLIKTAQGIAAVAKAAGYIMDVFRDTGNRATSSLETQLGLLKELREEQNKRTNPSAIQQDAKESVLKQIAEIEAELDRRRPKLEVPLPRGSARPSTKSSTDSKDAFERAQDTIEKRRALLEAETATIDLNTAARDRAKVVAELETAAKKANSEAGLKNTEVTEAQRLKINEIADAYLKVAEASEKANSPMARFAREASQVNTNLEEAAVSGLQSFETAVAGIVTGSTTAADAIKQMANAIIADLIRIAIRAAITGPIVRAIGGGFGGGPVDVGSATSVGQNASGTDNWRGGPTWVGERGPEIVNLPRGAQVIPNNVARGMGGGGITNNISVVNNAGADVKQQTSRNASRGQDMRIVIDPLIAQNVSTPGSASDRALRGRGQLVRR